MPRGSAGGQGGTGIAGVLDGLVDALEEQALLGIHHLGLARRDIEKEWVEAVHPVEKPAPLAVSLARLVAILIKVGSVVPALLGDFCNTVSTVLEVLPKGLDTIGHGIPPGQADDGN